MSDILSIVYVWDSAGRTFDKLVPKTAKTTVDTTGLPFVESICTTSGDSVLKIDIESNTEIKQSKPKMYVVKAPKIRKKYAFKFAKLPDAESFFAAFNTALTIAPAPTGGKSKISSVHSKSLSKSRSRGGSIDSLDSKTSQISNDSSASKTSAAGAVTPSPLNRSDSVVSMRPDLGKPTTTTASPTIAKKSPRKPSLGSSGSISSISSISSSTSTTSTSSAGNGSPVVTQKSVASILQNESKRGRRRSLASPGASSKSQKTSKWRTRLQGSSIQRTAEELLEMNTAFHQEAIIMPPTDSKPRPCRVFIQDEVFKSVLLKPTDTVAALKEKIARKVPGSSAGENRLYEYSTKLLLVRQMGEDEYPYNILVRWDTDTDTNQTLPSKAGYKIFFAKTPPQMNLPSSKTKGARGKTNSKSLQQTLSKRSLSEPERKREWDNVPAITSMKKSITELTNKWVGLQIVQDLKSPMKFQRIEQKGRKKTCYVKIDDDFQSLFYQECDDPSAPIPTTFSHKILLSKIMSVAPGRLGNEKNKIEESSLPLVFTLTMKEQFEQIGITEDEIPDSAKSTAVIIIDMLAPNDKSLFTFVDGLRFLLGRNFVCSTTIEHVNTFVSIDLDSRMFNLSKEMITETPPTVPDLPPDLNFNLS